MNAECQLEAQLLHHDSANTKVNASAHSISLQPSAHNLNPKESYARTALADYMLIALVALTK